MYKRQGVPIEPRLSEQWFLKYPRVEEAKQAVRDGHIKFFPKRWEKTYLHWLENIRDWCISRQLWWGHRIPVWYRKGLAQSDPANWHVAAIPPEDIEMWRTAIRELSDESSVVQARAKDFSIENWAGRLKEAYDSLF